MKTCTIISRSHLPFARVLADSYRSHNSGRIGVLLLDDVDDSFDGSGEPFDLIRPSELSLDRHHFHTMAAIYQPRELASALKPWLIGHLLSQGSRTVLYLDADMEVFSSLEAVDELARSHGLVLTPHLLGPLPDDGLLPRETDLLAAGTYNLGFIAVGDGCDDFLSWWRERLRRDCVVSPREGIFVDQRWMDLVPGLFTHHVLRDPAYNVAYWNLAERRLSLRDGCFLVDGRPLRCFHFSGYDPGKPHLLSRHQGSTPRILLSEHHALAALCGKYNEKLKSRGYGGHEAVTGYGFAFTANGIMFSEDMRRACRRLLKGDPSADGEGFPDPFDPDEAQGFIEWLNGVPPSAPSPAITRLLKSIHESRLDLQLNFPDPYGSDGGRFIDWVLKFGREEHGIPAECLPSKNGNRSNRGPGAARNGPGVNLAGYLNSQSGLGEAARLVLATLEAGEIPHSAVSPFTATLSEQMNMPLETAKPLYPFSIVCVNADQFPVFAQCAGTGFFEGRHTVGVVAWELDRFPDTIEPSNLKPVDEIWTYSDHSARALLRAVDKPVYKFPLPVKMQEPLPRTRSAFGLPEGFVFLFCFDFLSVMERKNPLAAIEAFGRAFAVEEGANLVIKTINGDKRVPEMERLLAAAGRPDVIVMDGYLDRTEQHALMASCDAFVSLHRAEGFGLTMAEAMALGRPVIATGYSGNLEFMTDRNSYLVPFRMIDIPEGCAPYPQGFQWADPDVGAASAFMRHVYDNREEAAARAERARLDMAEKHSPEARVDFICQRMEAITGGPAPARRRRASSRFSLKRWARGLTPP